MANEFPFFPLFVDDLIRDTRDMTTPEFGAYIRLLLEAWNQQPVGTLPNECDRLSRWAFPGQEQALALWQVVKPAVLSRFKLPKGPGRIRQKRMMFVYADLKTRKREKSRQASQAAKSMHDKKKRADAERTHYGGNAKQNENLNSNNTLPPDPPPDRYGVEPPMPADPVVVALLRGYGIAEGVCQELAGSRTEAQVRRASEKALIQRRREPEMNFTGWIISALREDWFEDKYAQDFAEDKRRKAAEAFEKNRSVIAGANEKSAREEQERIAAIEAMSSADLEDMKREYLATIPDGPFKAKIADADPKTNPTLQAYALKRLATVG